MNSRNNIKNVKSAYVKSMKKTGMICLIILNNMFLLAIMPFLVAMFYGMFNIAGEGEGYSYDRYAITYDSGLAYIFYFLLPLLIVNIVINRTVLATFKSDKAKHIIWIIYMIQVAYLVFVLSFMNVI